jgi:hypothetical protein
MTMFTFTFDLTGKAVKLNFGTQMYTYSASHVSLLGPTMALTEKQVMVTMGTVTQYVTPGSAHNSALIKMMNPPARYPELNLTDRAFGSAPQHPAEVGVYNGHDGASSKYMLSADEQFLLELMADNGGQYYSRENAPGGSY